MFNTTFGDDPEHEKLTAEIEFCGTYFALITQENGPENTLIEFDQSATSKEIPLEELITTLQNATKKLSKLNGYI